MVELSLLPLPLPLVLLGAKAVKLTVYLVEAIAISEPAAVAELERLYRARRRRVARRRLSGII